MGYKNIYVFSMRELRFGKSYFSIDECPFILRTTNYGLPVEHSHDFVQVLYMLKGCLRHSFRHETEQLHKGDIILIPPLWKHSMTTVDENTLFALLNFYPSFINPLFDHHYTLLTTNVTDSAFLLPLIEMLKQNRLQRIILNAPQLELIERDIEQIRYQQETRGPLYRIHIKHSLLHILLLITDQYVKRSDREVRDKLYLRYRPHIERVLVFLDKNYHKKINLPEVVKLAGMSQTNFNKFFKQHTGKTFVRYLNNLRIIKAIGLIKTSAKTMTEICYEIGFNDFHHFCKTFKKIVGYKTSEYRKRTATPEAIL